MHSGCVCLANVFLIVVSSNIAFVLSSFSVSSSLVVLIGDRVEMKCSVNESALTKWTYTAWNTSNETRVYLDSTGNIDASVRSRYNIDNNISGQHNLIIDSVDLAHAGRYNCTGVVQLTLWSHIQLTVLGFEPKCNTNSSFTDGGLIENSYLRVWCHIVYASNVVPTFSFTKENAQGHVVDWTSTTDCYFLALATTVNTCTSFISQLNSDDNGAKFKLWITSHLPNNNDESAIIPYAYTWNYTTIILYGPKNVTIVRLEDRLLCTADGNPNIIYNWINFEANRSTDGPVHLLNYTMEPNRSYTIQCEATNALASERKNISHVHVPTSRDSSEKQDVPDFRVTALAIGGSLLFLLMMAIVVSCIVRTKRLKDRPNTSHRLDVALHTDVSSYESGACTIADNAVYAQVMKPKGPSKGNKGGNIGESSRPHNAPKDVTGADGTVYAELSGVKPPDRKGKAQVPKTPAFNKVEIYASIDHCVKSPAPPLPPK